MIFLFVFVFLTFMIAVLVQLIVWTLNWCKTDVKEYSQVEYFFF